jgi:hypothetical protein
MKSFTLNQRRVGLTVALVLVAALSLWAFNRDRHTPLAALETHRAVSVESLFEKGDRPTTVFIRALAPTSGESGSAPVVIRQSKSRLNQMKQTVLAFLKGPSGNAWKSLAPTGTVLNQMFLTASGSAVVDLSVPSSQNFGFYEEALFASGLSSTLLQNFSEVKRVRLLNDGRESGSLTLHYALGTVESLSGSSAGIVAP